MASEERPLKVITIRIFESDLEKLQMYYAQVGYNVAIRRLISRHIQKLESKDAQGKGSSN